MEINQAIYEYCLRLGDNALILGHRLSEWCGHGPILEEDIALTNIALDNLGQASLFLKYAAEVKGDGKTEDDLAYLRDVLEFRNVLLVEQENGDYAKTLVRQFFYSAYAVPFYQALKTSKNEHLSAIAEKSLKEVTYHLRYTSDWMLRLGDGTEESNARCQKAIQELWRYTGELFMMDELDKYLIQHQIGIDLNQIKTAWEGTVKSVFGEATLEVPTDTWMAKGGKQGTHSEHLGYVLADMQYLQRAYPGCEW